MTFRLPPFFRIVAVCLVFLALPFTPAPAHAAPQTTAPATASRLANEPSPYLRGHAKDAVDWWPYGPAAFEEARRRNALVLISVGYSTCHWCHVQQKECYYDPEVAKAMSDGFVPVKVDREERPDVDHALIIARRLLTGEAGWPNLVAVTPGGDAVFAAGWLPRHTRDDRPGILDVLASWRTAYRDEPTSIATRIKRVREAVDQGFVDPNRDQKSSDRPTSETIRQAYFTLGENYDPDEGGFGRGSKFPQPLSLLLIQRWHDRTADPTALGMVDRTLDAMVRSGLRDHIGGGFFRYTVDGRWRTPHFEKMLHDQGLITLALLDGWQLLSRPQWLGAVRDTLDYIIRDMALPDGTFAAAEDAQTDGEEGVFYLWNPDQVTAVVGKENAPLLCRAFDISEIGNFPEGERMSTNGRSVPQMPMTLDQLAVTTKRSAGELDQALRSGTEAMRLARSRRNRPFRDDKMLTEWNAYAVVALARAGTVLKRGDKYTSAAVACAQVCLSTMCQADGTLAHGRVGSRLLPAPGYLVDQAAWIWACIELYRATWDPTWLVAARDLATAAQAHFRQADGTWSEVHTGDLASSGSLLGPTLAPYDGPTPAGRPLAAYALLRLGNLLGDATLEVAGNGLVQDLMPNLESVPGAYMMGLCAADYSFGPMRRVVVSGETSGTTTLDLLRTAAKDYRPRVDALFRPTESTAQAAATRAVLLKLDPALASLPTSGTQAIVWNGTTWERPISSSRDLAPLLPRK